MRSYVLSVHSLKTFPARSRTWRCRRHCAGHAILTLAYVVELESLCVGTADGALVLLRADGAAVEQVGSVAGGVTAAAWSPGGDALLVVTGHGILLLMNQASVLHWLLCRRSSSRLLVMCHALDSSNLHGTC